MKKLKNSNYPSLLSYKGSITPSLFYFYSLNQEYKDILLNEIKNEIEYNKIWEKINPIQSQEFSLFTTKSFYIEDNDKLEKTNGASIQKTEKAYLPANSDTLIITGSIRFFNNAAIPHAVNNKVFEDQCKEYFELFKNKVTFKTLATRYFLNLINERLLWENKFGEVEILIKIKNTFYFFNHEELLEVKEQNFNIFDIDNIKNPNIKEKIKNIIEKIENVFIKLQPILIELIYKVKMSRGQQVYPSQEFEKKSKKLAKQLLINNCEKILQVFFSDQKIGNAIRTIDTWYENNINSVPIAIEPYGINQSNRAIYRNKNNSFYDYFINLEYYIDLLNYNKYKDKIDIYHYIMACLIKGGVF